MGHRFLSREWLEAGRRSVAASKEFRTLIGKESATLLTVVTDVPGGGSAYVWYEFRDGELAQADVSTNGGLAERPAHFTITGSYDTFVKLQRGALTLQAAYFNRLVRLSGDIERALKFAPAFVKYNELVRQVETDY